MFWQVYRGGSELGRPWAELSGVIWTRHGIVNKLFPFISVWVQACCGTSRPAMLWRCQSSRTPWLSWPTASLFPSQIGTPPPITMTTASSTFIPPRCCAMPQAASGKREHTRRHVNSYWFSFFLESRFCIWCKYAVMIDAHIHKLWTGVCRVTSLLLPVIQSSSLPFWCVLVAIATTPPLVQILCVSRLSFQGIVQIKYVPLLLLKK